ncbi:MAG: MarR family transcriptional regulator [Deltaproteobacteria bacterium]|nr:MarR family transcriptional regulator [Candidatus Zymogenaceae bacterium]
MSSHTINRTNGDEAKKPERKDVLRHLERLFEQVAQSYVALEKTPRHFGTEKLFHMGEINTIDVVGRLPGINITELARELEVTKGAVSQMVKKLEKKGCVAAAKKPGNDKEVVLNLTKEGRIAYEYHQRHHAGLEKALRRIMERFDTEALADIRDMLEALGRYYTEYDSDDTSYRGRS